MVGILVYGVCFAGMISYIWSDGRFRFKTPTLLALMAPTLIATPIAFLMSWSVSVDDAGEKTVTLDFTWVLFALAAGLGPYLFARVKRGDVTLADEN